MYAYPYGMNNNMQQQLAQNRVEQLQQQYNNMFPMMQQQQAQNATLIATLRPTPIPAYQTCSSYESVQLFSHYGTACNNGCGC